MLMTSNRRAVSGLSSTFSLPTFTFPACSVAISSSTGAIILHGPHHSAQKSTMTGSDEALISSVNDVSLSVRMAPAIGPPLALPLGGRLDDVIRCLALGFEPALGVDGGHATGAGGGDRLPVGVVLHVAAGEHARDVRPGP